MKTPAPVMLARAAAVGLPVEDTQVEVELSLEDDMPADDDN